MNIITSNIIQTNNYNTTTSATNYSNNPSSYGASTYSNYNQSNYNTNPVNSVTYQGGVRSLNSTSNYNQAKTITYQPTGDVNYKQPKYMDPAMTKSIEYKPQGNVTTTTSNTTTTTTTIATVTRKRFCIAYICVGQ